MFVRKEELEECVCPTLSICVHTCLLDYWVRYLKRRGKEGRDRCIVVVKQICAHLSMMGNNKTAAALDVDFPDQITSNNTYSFKEGRNRGGFLKCLNMTRALNLIL